MYEGPFKAARHAPPSSSGVCARLTEFTSSGCHFFSSTELMAVNVGESLRERLQEAMADDPTGWTAIVGR